MANATTTAYTLDARNDDRLLLLCHRPGWQAARRRLYTYHRQAGHAAATHALRSHNVRRSDDHVRLALYSSQLAEDFSNDR